MHWYVQQLYLLHLVWITTCPVHICKIMFTTDLFHETPKDNHGDQMLNYIKFWFCPFRLMYWTDWGRQPKIECAWMDGQQRQTLVSEDLGWPTGLSIDYLNNDRIYWSDSKENIIESMRPDGTDRTVVLHGGKNLLCITIIVTKMYANRRLGFTSEAMFRVSLGSVFSSFIQG